MSDTPPPGWQVQTKPPVMSRRFDFSDYATTRGFLDRLETLSKETGQYPDLNFAKTHVNVSVSARDSAKDAALGPEDYAFAARVEALAAPATTATAG